MIADNLSATDIDLSHVANLASLFRRKDRVMDFNRPGLWVLAVNGRVEQAYHTSRGAIAAEIKDADLQDLAGLSRKFKAQVVLADRDALTRIAKSMTGSKGLDRKLLEQGLSIYDPDSRKPGPGGKPIHPLLRLEHMDRHGFNNIARLAAPSNELIIFAVFDSAARDLSGLPVFASVIIGFNRDRQVDLVTTTRSLASVGLDSIADWKTDHKKITKLTEKKFRPMAMAVFTSRDALAGLEQTPENNLLQSFSSLLKQEKIIIDPFPLKFRMLLKAGGVFR